jgi:hypothetical protein
MGFAQARKRRRTTRLSNGWFDAIALYRQHPTVDAKVFPEHSAEIWLRIVEAQSMCVGAFYMIKLDGLSGLFSGLSWLRRSCRFA